MTFIAKEQNIFIVQISTVFSFHVSLVSSNLNGSQAVFAFPDLDILKITGQCRMALSWVCLMFPHD